MRSLVVLANNAGAFPEEGNESLEQLPLDYFDEAFPVNVVGVARVTRSFLPLPTKALHPRVINISSLEGSVSQKEYVRDCCHSASKAAPNMLTRVMAAEFSPRGIPVAAVTPRSVKTELGAPQAPLTAEESFRSLAGTIERVSPQDDWQFLDRNGLKGVTAW